MFHQCSFPPLIQAPPLLTCCFSQPLGIHGLHKSQRNCSKWKSEHIAPCSPSSSVWEDRELSRLTPALTPQPLVPSFEPWEPCSHFSSFAHHVPYAFEHLPPKFPVAVSLYPFKMFVYFWESRGEAERERDRGSEVDSRLYANSREPNVGLELMNCEIMPWAIVGG